MSSGLLLGAAKASAHTESTHRNESTSPQRRALQDLINRSMALSPQAKLEAVNEFFNHQVRYGEDKDIWGQFDYWASPMETLERGAGDCEDFALAKYFTLRLMGISGQNLRLVYTTLNSNQQAHMVLGYWNDGAEVPVLLDNLHQEILPMAQRLDLQMQFAFDSGHLYRFEHTRLIVVGDAELLPSWQALKVKVKQEQL